MDPETAHHRITGWILFFSRFPFYLKLLDLRFGCRFSRLRVQVAGIDFPGPVGLAAGFDKTGELYIPFSHMGFDFIESGTFTAIGQEGNPKPRMFRYPGARALVNRMGFNNPGAPQVALRIQNQNQKIPRGINIGKSKVTPVEEALEDYQESLRHLASSGNYIAINVSSPNTPGLRTLQLKENLKSLLHGIQGTLKEISTGVPVPLFVKVAPDLSEEEFREALEVVDEEDLSGIIISNTTIDHSSVPDSMNETGGLSGPPVKSRSTEMIRTAFRFYQGRRAIIGVGGIESGEDAWEKICAGADLIQVYTGYIYEGPGLPCRIRWYLNRRLRREGKTLREIRGSSAV